MGRMVVIAGTVFLLCVPPSAAADAIRVASGRFAIDVEFDRFRFAGEGFDLVGALPPSEHVPGVLGPVCSTCRPGDIVDFSFRTIGEVFAGSGPAQFGGETYSEVFYLARLSFTATPTAFPAATGPGVSFRQPFTFEGTIRAFTDAQLTQFAFGATLRGAGDAGNFFFNSGPGTYAPDEPGTATYVFADTQPIPEPTTLLLLGSGIAGLMLRRRAP